MFEKEAEIYALSNYGFRGKNSQRVLTAKIDYQYGAEFGYNKANEWHDLRKNPDDLPEDSILYEVLNQNGARVFYDDALKKWYMYNGSIVQVQTPIAWCEIPKFEEMED